MGLSEGQRTDVRNFLISRGLAFKPLLDEMSDHLGCDIEEKMKDGLSYEDAWAVTINELPEDHFKTIQKETMETINQRFALSRVFTYIAMGALLIATMFKILHLRGADTVLILSFVALSISLLIGSVSGIYFNRNKKGALRVLGIAVGTVMLTIGYAFKITRLPGGDELVLGGVMISLIAMVANTLYIYKNPSGNGNLFTFLHEKYSPGIERFLLILLVPMVVYKTMLLLSHVHDQLFPIIHLVVIYAAGLQFIAMLWRNVEADMEKRNVVTLFSIIAAFTCLSMPFLGSLLPFDTRLGFVTVFSFIAAFLVFRLEPSRDMSSWLACIVPLVFLILALVKKGILSSFTNDVALNVILISVIVGAIVSSRKHTLLRTYLILSLAGYFVEV